MSKTIRSVEAVLERFVCFAADHEELHGRICHNGQMTVCYMDDGRWTILWMKDEHFPANMTIEGHIGGKYDRAVLNAISCLRQLAVITEAEKSSFFKWFLREQESYETQQKHTQFIQLANELGYQLTH